MGCGASTPVPPEIAAHCANWTELIVRIRWSGFENESPDLLLKIFDAEGAMLFRLEGGVSTGSFKASHPKPATFSPYRSSWRMVGAGKKQHKEQFIAGEKSSTEYFKRPQKGRWRRVSSDPAAAALPAGLRLSQADGLIKIFTDGEHAPADEGDAPREVAIEQPDGSTVMLAQREASPLDNLIATVATSGKRPRHDNGNEDMCGDKLYKMMVKPALLPTDKSAQALFFAMCTDPFWSRGDQSVGYFALSNHGAAM